MYSFATDLKMKAITADSYQESKASWLTPEERVSFYLNNQESFEIDLGHFKEVQNLTYLHRREMKLIRRADYNNSFIHWYCTRLVHQPLFRDLRGMPFYEEYKNLLSLRDFFLTIDEMDDQYHEQPYPMFFGETDELDGIPCIRKARRISDETGVLFLFRTLRHNYPCFEAQRKDIPWHQKKTNVIWRGATTGRGKRVEFVENYIDKYDVAFSSIKQMPHLTNLKRGSVSIEEQLQNKFIISLPGHELASNLRWVLSSNSVPIMPRPDWHSWIVESRLEPNVHYLELNDDFSNLNELLAWAEENDKACEQIAINGKNYISQFLNIDNDLPVQKLLLEEYAKRVTYIN